MTCPEDGPVSNKWMLLGWTKRSWSSERLNLLVPMLEEFLCSAAKRLRRCSWLTPSNTCLRLARCPRSTILLLLDNAILVNALLPSNSMRDMAGRLSIPFKYPPRSSSNKELQKNTFLLILTLGRTVSISLNTNSKTLSKAITWTTTLPSLWFSSSSVWLFKKESRFKKNSPKNNRRKRESRKWKTKRKRSK